MTKISFIVPGDPVPYLRMTQGQVKLMRIPWNRIRSAGVKVKAQIERYLAYKRSVYQASLLMGINRAPKSKVILNVKVYFRDGRHGDPENIRKGIQDAIYKNDRYVAGSVDFDMDPENPRAEVEILQG